MWDEHLIVFTDLRLAGVLMGAYLCVCRQQQQEKETEVRVVYIDVDSMYSRGSRVIVSTVYTVYSILEVYVIMYGMNFGGCACVVSC